jgi:hypothetical protein
LSEPEGRAGLTDKLDADVRATLGRIVRVPQLLVATGATTGAPRACRLLVRALKKGGRAPVF